MIKKILYLALLLPLSMYSQNGGQTAFSFVNIETSPRTEAMGGSLITVVDNDLSLVNTTPSLLNSKMNNELQFSFVDYFSDISVMGFVYAKEIKSVGVFSFGVNAVSYGDFELNDNFGNNTGTFTANDQVITLGVAKSLNNNFSLGVNIKLLNSQYESYNALALSSNVSLTYNKVEKAFTSTVLFKNIGRQLQSYTNVKEDIPFEIQMGVSKQLAHLPFRYAITLHHLNQYDISSPYKLGNITDSKTNQLIVKKETVAKKMLRHVIIGGELNPFKKSLFIRGGFNFQRRFDMSLVTRPATVGFSFGIGFKVSKFRFDYSRAAYHLTGTPNNFSIATNISTFGI